MVPRAIVAAALACALAACAGSSVEDDGLIHVVTTVSPITNLAANVGGEHVQVTGLVPEGQNSHEFEPAPSDARVIADADVMFVNGLNLELPSIELAEPTLSDDAEIVELGTLTIEPADYIFDFSFPASEGDPNPHLWTNPPYAKRYAQIIAETLSDLDPGNADDYRDNYEALAERFDALDRAVREATATVPRDKRKLLTYHDSFPYFAREYGWEVVGAIQPSDFAEPRPREVARLIDQIRAEKVPAIFGSEVFASDVLEQIASATGAEYVDDLRDDDLPGSRGDPEHSLVGLLTFDYQTFIAALGGDVAAFDEIGPGNVTSEENAVYRE